ncbi:flagellar biosynthesis protein FlhB [Thermovibrio sp.]
MAKDPSKTEKATPRRREKAREEGQVLRSQDLPISATLLFTSALLLLYLPFLFRELRELFYYSISQSGYLEDSLISKTLFFKGGVLLLPVLGALLVVGVVSNLIQFGFLFTLKPLVPKLDNLNPIKGLGRLFSFKTLFEAVKNALKLTVALVLGYYALKHSLSGFYSFPLIPFSYQVELLFKWTVILFFTFGLLSIPVAAADFFYRRWEYEENLKMSKQEVKEERKQYEGHPLIKSAIRKRQREIAMRRMMAEVPKADVVITNPTHYAVALKYERGKMVAPKVVAKGVDKVALKIRKVAVENGVPIEDNPELARALYSSCEVGDYIPEEFYRVVAKILAKIYSRRSSF